MRTRNWKNIISLLWLFTASTQLSGQPLSPTKWYRIRTPHVDIVFKGNINREAQRVANTLEILYEPVSQSLGVRPAKIALVLRNQKAFPNGFVTLAPRRAEFFTFPTQDYNLSSTNEWLNVVSVHEWRHVAQYAQLQQNFNQLFYWLGGDLSLSAMIGLNVPAWFLEGDAVGIETALTQSGRGRIPYFSLLYRTNLLARGRFSYTKQVLGSFKDPVPDRYSLGYHLTTHLRRKYGPTVLRDIFQRTTRPSPFYATKQITGKSLVQIHEDANQELESLWQKQLKGLKLTQATRLNTRRHTDYTDYAYPQLDHEGNIIVLKSGIGAVAQFVALDGQQRGRKIFTPGDIDREVGFSVAQNQMVWVETIPDLRWEDRSYGVIQRYDTQAKRLKTITHKSRYGAAALSPDATQIVALESDEEYHHQLVILDAQSGQVLQRLPNPDNNFYRTPKWSADGKQVVVLKHVQQRVTITLIDVTTGETQDLLPYSTEQLGCPVMIGKYVFYNSAYSGIDNIYAIDLVTHQRYQVTSRKYGAYNPTISADGYWLIFNDFTKNGMDVVKMPFVPREWTPLAQIEDRSVHYYAPLVMQEDNNDVLANIPNRTYPVERYHPWKHILNVHSWLTLKDVTWDTDALQQSSALPQKGALNVLNSKDLLGTTELGIDYLHHFGEKYGQASAKISYKGWYPVFSLEGELKKGYKERGPYDKRLGLTLELPLQFVRGQYTQKFFLSIINSINKINKINKDIFYTQGYKCVISRNSKKSLKDIYPPWQQKLTTQYHHTPQEGDFQKQYGNVQVDFFFPGLRKHHAFRLGAAYQYHYSTVSQYQKEEEQKRIVKMNYEFPFYYPDWDIGYLFYVKRLRANASYDFVDNVHPPKNKPRYTNNVGVVAWADVHIFTLLNIPQLSVGIEYLYAWEERDGSFRFALSVKPPGAS